MTLIADFLLISGATLAALYCMVLSRRLKKLNNLDQGVGAAIAALAGQVRDLEKALAETQLATRHSSDNLVEITRRSEVAAERLELMLATLDDMPETAAEPISEPSAPIFRSTASAGRTDGPILRRRLAEGVQR